MITVEWANIEKTLLKWSFGQQWSREDFLASVYKSKIMVEEQSHTVHVVVDLSVSRIHPSSIVKLALNGMRQRSKNTGTIVVISPSNLWLRLYQYMKRVYAKDVLPVEFVDSHYDAMKVLGMPFFKGNWDDTKKKLPAYTGHAVAPFYYRA